MNVPLMGGEKGKLLIGSKLNACLLLLAIIGCYFFSNILSTDCLLIFLSVDRV